MLGGLARGKIECSGAVRSFPLTADNDVLLSFFSKFFVSKNLEETHGGIVGLMVCAVSGYLFADEQSGKLSQEVFVQKAQKIQMPFIANEGQADGEVEYYAKTFGGTVCVTKDGGIVYMLPKHEAEAKKDDNCRNGGEGNGYLVEECAVGIVVK